MECENAMYRRTVTILFMDIVGFSRLCEILSPDDLMKVTTEYLESMCDCIVRCCHGVLDKEHFCDFHVLCVRVPRTCFFSLLFSLFYV